MKNEKDDQLKYLLLTKSKKISFRISPDGLYREDKCLCTQPAYYLLGFLPAPGRGPPRFFAGFRDLR